MKKICRVIICTALFICAMSIGYTRAEVINTEDTKTIDSNDIIDTIENKGSLVILSSGNLQVDELVNNIFTENSGSIISKNIENSVQAVFENNGIVEIAGNLRNDGIIINSGKFEIGGVLMNSNLINSGSDAVLDVDSVINLGRFGVADSACINIGSLENYGKIELTNNSGLTLENQSGDIEGTVNVLNGTNSLISSSNCNIIGELNIGDGSENTTLILDNINITESAITNVTSNSTLYLKNGAGITLNNDDTMLGNLILDGDGNITFDNFVFESNNITFYEQNNGQLNLLNDSLFSIEDISKIKNGVIVIDSTSAFIIKETNYDTASMKLQSLQTSGMFSAMNSKIELFNIETLQLDGTSVNNPACYTIDIEARGNSENNSDRFAGAVISNGFIEISDWKLGGDIFGHNAPIDKDIALNRIFDYSNAPEADVKISIARKEVFTPIGWYQLNNTGGMNGNWSLNLTRFNPQVYRGQVTTLAQWMNQLAIDDMLFNHSMLLPSFKDEDGGYAYSGTMANRYASTMPQYAPYQYSRKDGGLWMKMYGTFETLQMSQGLSNVGNNAYGTLIGADFGLKELKNGWKFMPTAYIGYNGAHQYYSGLGAYQNGGQAGFLGTWYKNNFIIGGLVYGGVYDNSMDIAGHTDSTFNYFAGAATKAAYNWRFHRDWVLQPNLFLAYNFFGQQNWHSAYGQMGMMSGMLNGVNIAPGLNLIWEKETFSIYATLQYMYNVNGAVGGRAGNVSLPHLDMDRGYIQYGIGFTKRFTDRFAGYFQTVFRNVGRTGVGFQLGFNWMIGK